MMADMQFAVKETSTKEQVSITEVDLAVKLFDKRQAFGGEGGIRTPGTRKGKLDFESYPCPLP
jgi:hypothetical protein